MNVLHKSIFILFVYTFFGTACAQKENNDLSEFNKSLGNNVSIIKNATKVEVAELRIVSFSELKETALTSKDRIAGYPLKSKLSILNKTSSDLIKTELTNNSPYISRLMRCANRKTYGVRFTHNSNIVEFALGLPCHQVIFGFHEKNKVKLWGSVLSQITSAAILPTIKSAIKK